MVEVDSHMRQFLQDRKININNLAKEVKAEGTETTAARNARLRELAISKREIETSTLKLEDYFHTSVIENYVIGEALHEACFTKCATKKDITYLTMQEGLCFRNCMNKFNNWYPRLEENTRGAAYKTYYGLTSELEADLKKQ